MLTPDSPAKRLFPVIPSLEGKRILMRKLEEGDAAGLRNLTGQRRVYRYLPTFLFEKRYGDPLEVIRRLYGECLNESLILGIFMNGQFCGLAEMYGYREQIRKISVGYRLREEFWGQGIATEALGMMIGYLMNGAGIDIITASTMTENHASAGVLRKNGFELAVHAVGEDWGYKEPTIADKWIR